ncbi:MAG: hypothetical protein AAFX79_04130 [Planctomycetota bacterium]
MKPPRRTLIGATALVLAAPLLGGCQRTHTIDVANTGRNPIVISQHRGGGVYSIDLEPGESARMALPAGQKIKLPDATIVIR